MPPKPQPPICPKCAYDQSGEITTWKTKCPLQGQCPECGLTFQWFHIFNPHLTRLPWYTEHARSFFQLIQRTPSTLSRLILPNIFWSRLPITATLSIKVLTIWYILLALAAHLLVSSVFAYAYYSRINSKGGWYWTQFKARGLYAYLELAFNSIFQSLFEIGTTKASNGLNSTQIQWTGFFTTSNILVRPISFSLGINLMWLLILLLIPTTRRLAKVRTAHILRAFILSMLCTLLILQASRFNLQGITYYWRMHHELLGYRPKLQLLILWQLLFWPAAIIIGWKIKPAKLLIALGTTAALLAGLLLNITLFILPDLL